MVITICLIIVSIYTLITAVSNRLEINRLNDRMDQYRRAIMELQDEKKEDNR